MKKVISIVLMMVISLFSVTGCNSGAQESVLPTAEPVDLTLGALSGYCAMSMTGIINSGEYGDVEIAETADELKTMFINGEIDIATVPLNMAGKLYNETEGNVRLFAVTNLCALNILDCTGEVKNIADLAGKTVYSYQQGMTEEYILNYILMRNDITDKVTVEYKANYDELLAAVISGEAETIMLPQPQTASLLENTKGHSTDINVVVDLNNEWLNITSSIIAQGCLIVKADFAEANEQAIKSFISSFGDSVEFINEDTDAAAQIMADTGITENKSIALNSVEAANIVCVVGTPMLEMARNTVEILYGMDAQSMGGEIPGNELYLTYEE
ncbi:MAG: ABC transporter substrate-binding protein [Clostridia bacterium]|nr:ABC transporter substrate-binding protein [Clostridia bacterium]